MISESLLYGILYTSAASSVLPVGGWLVHRKQTPYLSALLIFVGVAGLFEALGLLFHFSRLPNMFLLHTYTLVEATLLFVLFRATLQKYLPYWFGIICLVLLFGVELFQIVQKLDYLDHSNSYTRSLMSLFIIGMSLYHFFLFFLSKISHDGSGASPIWITSGLLLYFSGNFTLFLFSEAIFFVLPVNESLGVFIIHSFLNILKFVLITTGIVLLPKKIAGEAVSFSGQ